MTLLRRMGAAFAAALACGAASAAPEDLLALTLPRTGTPPYPAVLLLHGCSGIQPNQALWQEFLSERGYASANVDSLTKRHVDEVCTNSTRVPMPERVRDAYEGLVELVKRSDIDPKRVALMGFSNGGVATLAALTSTVNAQLLPNSPRFRAGIPFYADCGIYRGPFAAPILNVVGELDDWTPAQDCVNLAAKIPAGRPPFLVKVLPNAHHSFDNLHQRRYYYGNANNMHKPGGYGATVEGSAEATELAKKEVEAFLARELAPVPAAAPAPAPAPAAASASAPAKP